MLEIILTFRIDLLDLLDCGLMKLLDRITARRKRIYTKWASLKRLIP